MLGLLRVSSSTAAAEGEAWPHGEKSQGMHSSQWTGWSASWEHHGPWGAEGEKRGSPKEEIEAVVVDARGKEEDMGDRDSRQLGQIPSARMYSETR